MRFVICYVDSENTHCFSCYQFGHVGRVTGNQDFMAALQSPEFDGPGAEAWIVGEARLMTVNNKSPNAWCILWVHMEGRANDGP